MCNSPTHVPQPPAAAYAAVGHYVTLMAMVGAAIHYVATPNAHPGCRVPTCHPGDAGEGRGTMVSRHTLQGA